MLVLPAKNLTDYHLQSLITANVANIGNALLTLTAAVTKLFSCSHCIKLALSNLSSLE